MPPGRKTRQPSWSAARDVVEKAQAVAEGHEVEGAVVERQGFRDGPEQGQTRAACSRPGQHGAARIDADDAARAGEQPDGGPRHGPGPGPDVEHRHARAKPRALQRPAPVPGAGAEADQPARAIVPGGRRFEVAGGRRGGWIRTPHFFESTSWLRRARNARADPCAGLYWQPMAPGDRGSAVPHVAAMVRPRVQPRHALPAGGRARSWLPRRARLALARQVGRLGPRLLPVGAGGRPPHARPGDRGDRARRSTRSRRRCSATSPCASATWSRRTGGRSTGSPSTSAGDRAPSSSPARGRASSR